MNFIHTSFWTNWSAWATAVCVAGGFTLGWNLPRWYGEWREVRNHEHTQAEQGQQAEADADADWAGDAEAESPTTEEEVEEGENHA